MTQKPNDGILEGADAMAKEIDKEVLANLLAASKLMSGDGGYQESTFEKYEEFKRKRNYPIPGETDASNL